MIDDKIDTTNKNNIASTRPQPQFNATLDDIQLGSKKEDVRIKTRIYRR